MVDHFQDLNALRMGNFQVQYLIKCHDPILIEVGIYIVMFLLVVGKELGTTGKEKS